ncbi:Uncharacterized protein TCM_022644 [Theobroma cacao]|uniref:Uncharacterized protein n=1 Tax=Theobroma cacao TaxID=3641 RepID=A0A061EV69_THECC|nr:Uncharacterized protein TCM_022644 [Theobroma cacao]
MVSGECLGSRNLAMSKMDCQESSNVILCVDSTVQGNFVVLFPNSSKIPDKSVTLDVDYNGNSMLPSSKCVDSAIILWMDNIESNVTDSHPIQLSSKPVECFILSGSKPTVSAVRRRCQIRESIREILFNEAIKDGFGSDNSISDEDIAHRNKIILLEANST